MLQLCVKLLCGCTSFEKPRWQLSTCGWWPVNGYRGGSSHVLHLGNISFSMQQLFRLAYSLKEVPRRLCAIVFWTMTAFYPFAYHFRLPFVIYNHSCIVVTRIHLPGKPHIQAHNIHFSFPPEKVKSITFAAVINRKWRKSMRILQENDMCFYLLWHFELWQNILEYFKVEFNFKCMFIFVRNFTARKSWNRKNILFF